MFARFVRVAIPLALATACAASKPATPPPAAAAPTPDATTDKIKAALAGGHRSVANSARDKYRHPVETLSFFGLRDTMTVVELWPGAGWYTEVLAPVLRERGHLTVTSGDPNGDPDDKEKGYAVKRAKEMVALKEKHPEIFDKVEMAIINPPDSLVFGAPGSADMVVTFRNMHGWISNGQVDAILKAVFAVLKPGGIFGVEDHRGNDNSDPKSGYVPEAKAIALIEAAGFKLVEKSEVNANPKDTHDHPKGVWTLPPTLRLGDQDREKYLAIGESDRFTMKFVKP